MSSVAAPIRIEISQSSRRSSARSSMTLPFVLQPSLGRRAGDARTRRWEPRGRGALETGAPRLDGHEAGGLVGSGDRVLADARLHFLVDGHERLLPLEDLGRGGRVDRHLAALPDLLQVLLV